MNALREYNPRLFEILQIEPRLMSKSNLSKELYKWLNINNYFNQGIINVNDELISELTGFQLNTQHNITGKGWEFTTKVYKKWKHKP